VTVAVTVQLQQWSERIDTLDLRERILLLAATLVVLYLIVDSLGLQPALKSHQVAEQRIADLELKMSALHQQANLFNYKTDHNPLASRYESRGRLAAELSELDARIVGQLGALVEPAQAAEVLEQVLTGHRGLKLKSLQASSESLDSPALHNNRNSAGLGRYQLEMVVEGAYLDLLRYLQELEAMPWKFFWQKVGFQTTEHPQAETRLRLYTLGAQHG
jgi:MSHA biogenesis protein MshJ